MYSVTYILPAFYNAARSNMVYIAKSSGANLRGLSCLLVLRIGSIFRRLR